MWIKNGQHDLWKTENLSTFFSTSKIQYFCGFELLFNNNFLYYYCY